MYLTAPFHTLLEGMHVEIGTAETSTGNAQPTESAPAPAAPKAKPGKYDDLQTVGIIYGNVGTTEFNLGVTSNLEKMEYVQVEHESDGWVLGQVIEMERRTDLSLEKAKMVSEGHSIDIEEKVTALINIVGYRDDRGLLQVPRTPFKAGHPVYLAKDGLIKDVIGLQENTDTGADEGLLFGHDIRVEVDINSMVQKHVSILAKTGGGKSFLCGTA